MDTNINKKAELLKQALYKEVNNCELPVVVAYLIVQGLEKDLAQAYLQALQQEDQKEEE